MKTGDVMRIFLAPLAAGLLLTACGDTGSSPVVDGGPHPLPVLPEGKADNYVSSNAREFELTGTAHAALPEGWAELEEEAKQSKLQNAVDSRLNVVVRAVKSHIDKTIRESNGGLTGEDAKYFSYFKRGAGELVAIEDVADGKVPFSFFVELIGSVRLMSQVAPESGSKRTFEIEVKDWGETEGEKVVVEMAGSDSRDAFPRYDALFEDGVFDIAIHFGGDYNEGRHDLETAKWTVEYLLEGGWTNEAVEKFEDLALDSPPFSRKLTVEGKEVDVQVYLYHSELDGGGDQRVLTDSVKVSVAERDVVVYSGHAGQGAGFLLDYHPRFQLAASDFATLPLAEKYQIYIFDGCNTYRSYVDDMLKNPAKTFDNLDLVTTVNTTPFGAGYQVIHELLYWFTLTGADGSHFPITWKDLLRGVNEDFEDVHYGVHGIDQDPQLNPHASEGVACTPCTTDEACGAGGNFCLNYAAGGACGVACTTDTACGDGYRCARLFDDPDLWYLPKQCVRRDFICPAG